MKKKYFAIRILYWIISIDKLKYLKKCIIINMGYIIYKNFKKIPKMT